MWVRLYQMLTALPITLGTRGALPVRSRGCSLLTIERDPARGLPAA
jgi:hypothetical protein